MLVCKVPVLAKVLVEALHCFSEIRVRSEILNQEEKLGF